VDRRARLSAPRTRRALRASGWALGGPLALLALCACASAGLPPSRVLARGVLPYGVATAGDTVVTVELSERFELVVRDGVRERRLDLGPPEQDLRALAVAGGHAFVGSDAGFIREIELASLRLRHTYAVGAPLRALAADARYLLSADASGAVCLRRRADAALLQCVRPDAPVTALAIRGELAWLSGPPAGQGPPLVAWALPSLRQLSDSEVARAPSTPPPPARFRDGAVYPQGHQVIWQRGGERQVLAELATDVRSITLTASGSLIVAAWPRSLDDAVLLLIRR
jgi:hypothetical protein